MYWGYKGIHHWSEHAASNQRVEQSGNICVYI